jgi:predicted trehalose synthase
MMRSFAYAASASQLLRGVPAPDGWEQRAREGFLEAYLAAVEPALLPAGRPATEKLLQIFELEKAVYELRYELNNRPDWVPIPVAGIARLLEAEVTQ